MDRPDGSPPGLPETGLHHGELRRALSEPLPQEQDQAERYGFPAEFLIGFFCRLGYNLYGSLQKRIRNKKEFEMDGLFQPTHLFFILLIVLIIFGPGKLPELGRGVGKGIREFKDAIKGGAEKPAEKAAEEKKA